MQPNLDQQNQTPLQVGSNGLQPSTYYEFSSPQPTPTAPQKAKTGIISTILAIIFGIISVALVVFIVLDKVAPKDEIAAPTAVAEISLSTPLSSIETAKHGAALSGRIFTVDGTFEQSIKFLSATEYEYSYYKAPSTDRAKYDLSIKQGSFTVNNGEISLDSGDVFIIQGDYLVKKTDKLSANKSTVYFDSQQLYSTYTKITKAFKAKLASWGGEASFNANKVSLNHLSCTTDSKRLTNADNYICQSNFNIYFNEADITSLLTEQKANDFIALCDKYDGLKYYAGTCSEDYSINTERNLVVRITDNTDYSITGVWTDAEVVIAPIDTEDNNAEE